jgi:hypothetical protein
VRPLRREAEGCDDTKLMHAGAGACDMDVMSVVRGVHWGLPVKVQGYAVRRQPWLLEEPLSRCMWTRSAHTMLPVIYRNPIWGVPDDVCADADVCFLFSESFWFDFSIFSVCLLFWFHLIA